MNKSTIFLHFLVQVMMCSNVLAQEADQGIPVSEKKSAPSNDLSNEAILSLSYRDGGLGFGIMYKKEFKSMRFFRIGLANMGVSTFSNTPDPSSIYSNKYLDLDLALVTGFEFRFRLHPIVYTYTGIDLLVGYSHEKRTIDFFSTYYDDRVTTSHIVQVGFAFNSGVQVKVHEVIMVGINISPDIFYARRMYKDHTDEKMSDDAFGTSFSSSSVQAQIIFNWPRKK